MARKPTLSIESLVKLSPEKLANIILEEQADMLLRRSSAIRVCGRQTSRARQQDLRNGRENMMLRNQ